MKMRIFLGVLMLASILCNNAFGQAHKGDEIVGTWLMETGESKIRIYRQNGEYFGKMIWSKNMYEPDEITPKKDVNNTKANLRERPLKDLPLLHHFKFDKNEWSEGKIYDIKSGKMYSCVIKLKSSDVMIVRGYIGISLLGKNVSFNRIK